MTAGDGLRTRVGRCATFVVAANNSHALSKQQADYICDGTDDDVQIQAAIDALPANGGKVIQTEGTFNTTSTINILSDNITLSGFGAGTIIKSVADNQIVIQLGNAETMVDNCIIESMEIDCNNGSYTSSSGIKCYKTTNCVIRECEVHHVSNNHECIEVDGINSDLLIIKCHVHHAGISASDSDGIEINSTASYITVQDCVIHDCQDDGIDTDGTSFIKVVNNYIHDIVTSGIEYNSNDGEINSNYIEGAGTGIFIGSGCERINVESNKIESNVNGIKIYPTKGTSVIGNTIWDNSENGIHMLEYSGQYTTSCIINDNVVNNNHHSGIFVQHAASNVTISDNLILNNNLDYVTPTHYHGIELYSTSIESFIITGNTCSDNQAIHTQDVGISVKGTNHTILGNVCEYNRQHGLYVRGNYCVVSNNICNNNSQQTAGTYSGIYIYNDGNPCTYNIISNNSCNDTDSKQGYGIREYDANSNHNIITSNIALNNVNSQIIVNGLNTTAYDKYTDLLMDVLAVSTTHIRSNEDLSAATPITFALDAQPDVPRTLSWSFDAHAQITEYDMEVIGIDVKGNTVTETWDETAGWSGETSHAFAIVTSIKMTSRTGTGAADTMDIGITDVLGLSNIIHETSDVFKIKKNNANAAVATAQVNTTYNTYDMSVISLGAGDDFTIWYRSNLNIIS